MQRILVALGLVVAGLPAGAQPADPDEPEFTVETITAAAILSHRWGRTVTGDDVQALWLDLDGDELGELVLSVNDPQLCGQDACGPMLLMLSGEGYVDLFRNLTLPSLPPVVPFSLGRERNGMLTIVLQDTTLSWNGREGTYEDANSIVPGALSTQSFVERCMTFEPNVEWAASEDGDPAARLTRACGCIADDLAERGFLQVELDALELSMWPSYVAEEELEEVETDEKDLEWAWLDAAGNEATNACMFATGSEFTDPGQHAGPFYTPTPGEAAPFLSACAADSYVVADRSIRTQERALALCGCVAERFVIGGGVAPENLTLLASLHAGEIVEEEVEAAAPGLLERTDEHLDWCLMRVRER